MTISRRSFGRTALGIAATAATATLTSCYRKWKYSEQDLPPNGTVQELDFRMTEVGTGKTVTQADFRGKVTILYFGYTNCPNVCPLTLYEMSHVLRALGTKADELRFLFVTVDPGRDTASVLKRYLALYHRPEFVGLRGDEASLHRLAARCHAAYSVKPSPDPVKYTVTHTAAAYVFDRNGKPEFICAGLSSKKPDLAGITRDLRHVIG